MIIIFKYTNLILLLTAFTVKADLYAFNSKDNQAFINGRVVDERKFPVPYAKVIVGNTEVLTDRQGKFVMTNVNTPYDLTVAEKTSSTAVIYKGLTITNPEIVLFGDLENRYSNYVSVIFSFPKIPEGGSAVAKLVSQEIFECKEVNALAGDSTAVLNFIWPASENYLKGQIVFILKDENGFQNIKFTDVTVNKNDIKKKVRITGKKGGTLKTSAVNVYLPSEKSLRNEFDASLNFFNYSSNSQIIFSEYKSDKQKIQVRVPDDLPITSKILLTDYGTYDNNSGYISYNYVSPGADVKLYTESPPELFTPSDNYLGTTENTNFTYSLGSGTGIYVLEFKSNNPYIRLYIVTSERQSRLSYLSRSEFYNFSYEFTWSVRKYITYFNTDEFVRPVFFKNNFSYRAVLYSNKRKFKTGYY
ncbi:MAG: carboxypeptidase regulatory-like domain-containing protein [Bacteroidetes bacterium]|nr:carboxypeptidase regulatory-like domain-containing protein [Bacteroidota bacterium]